MYEEEKQRSDHLNSATNTYLVFITFAFTFTAGLINFLHISTGVIFSKSISLIQSLVLMGISLALLLIILSLILTILVVKIRRFERLCNPKDFAVEMANIEDEYEILTSITSHYIVATERNHLVNNDKARLLGYGLQAYIIGFMILIVSVSTFLLT
jgi:hypothetical protein